MASSIWLMQSRGFLQLVPFLRVAVALILGMVVSHEWFGGQESAIWFALLVVCLPAACLLGRHAILQSVAILLAVFFLGGYLMAAQLSRLKTEYSGKEELYKAVLLSEPVERGKVVRFDMMVTTGRLAGKKVRASLLKDTVDQVYRHLHVGDGILASSVFEPLRAYSDSSQQSTVGTGQSAVGTSQSAFAASSSGTSYRRYLETSQFVAQTFVFWHNWRKAVVPLTGLSLVMRTRLAALSLRQRIIARIGSLGFDSQDDAVVLAMALGDRRLISHETRALYAASGASHVLALSGLHLGLVYMFLSLLLARWRRKALGESLLLLAIWAYVFLVGMPSSVVRAAIMITLYGLASLANRDKMSLNALSLAAILMLVASPLQLLDVGFQLSFLSVASIVVLYRPFSFLFFAVFPFMTLPVVRSVCGLLLVSFCAQLATVPLVAYYFGYIPVYGLLSSLVVVPLAYVILGMSVAWIATFSLPVLSSLVASVLAGIVHLQNQFLAGIAMLPGANIKSINMSPLQVLMLYVAIFCFSAVVVLYSSSLARKRGV